jgi:hypothetical protein
MLLCVCFRAHDNQEELRYHLEQKHFANYKEIKTEFQEEKQNYDPETATAAQKHNYELALLKLTMMEKIRKRRRQRK